MLSEIGKSLIYFGLFLIFFGFLILFSKKIPYFGKLPGDIYIQRKNFQFYFPITSFLILSIFLSLLINIIFKIFKR